MTAADDYQRFLAAKVVSTPTADIEIEHADVNPILKPHQAAIVRWMVRGGRRACFAAFGLGKSIIQLETLRLTLERVGGRALIVIPLGVRQEFFRDAAMLGITVKFIRSIEEAGDTGIYLTNYETVRDGKLNPRLFIAASLDEAAVLRGFGGTKTFREFMRLFAGDGKTLNERTRGADVPYRFVATATPSPNDYIELLSYAAFLGVMDVSAAKTRFFKRDSTKADVLTIHPHKEREFWLWVSSWAIFLQRPSDIGFSDEGYELPPLDVRWHQLATDHKMAGSERDGQAKMFKNAALGIIEASHEKRESLTARVEKVLELIANERTGTIHQSSPDRCLQGVPTGVPVEALPSAQINSAERGEVRETRVSEEISRGAQGGISGRTARAGQARLPEEHNGMQRAVTSMEGGKPRTIQSARKGSPVEESREVKCAEPGVVSSAQNASHIPSQKTEAGEVRANAGAISGATRSTERRVRDLRGSASAHVAEGREPARRPLPCDGDGSRPSLPALQFGAGDVQGRSVPAHDGSGLPDQVIVWCDLNDEQDAIERGLRDAGITFSSLRGSQDIDDRDALLQAWRDYLTSVFLSKPTMYGAGANLQQSHTMIFCGIGFKAQDFLQAIHRIHRFQQIHRCVIHILYTEAESKVRRTLERKWVQYEEMVAKMTDIIREHGLAHSELAREMTRAMGVERIEVTGENHTLVNWDAILETRRMKANSQGLILTSIPFSSQYEYSPNYADLGHSDNNAHFFQQMDFLTPELLRVLMPGRIAAIHVKDRIVPGGMTGLGFQVVYPFHARCIEHYTRHGFAYMGMKTIVTDVVRENNQTYRLGWSEQCKDGTKMGVGMPEYLLLFRKPPTDTSNAYADEPVVKSKPLVMDEAGDSHPHGGRNDRRPMIPGTGYSRSRWQIDAHGFERSSGNRPLTPEDFDGIPHERIFKLFREFSLTNVYDFEHHVRLGEEMEMRGALPVTFMLLQPQSWSDEVWTDITRMLTLNGAQSAKGKEMHLCPMQFDLADRVIAQMSNPGDEVYDPFVGIGTVVQRAILLGRKGRGVDLSTPYFLDACYYARAAEAKIATPTLFDLVVLTPRQNEEDNGAHVTA